MKEKKRPGLNHVSSHEFNRHKYTALYNMDSAISQHNCIGVQLDNLQFAAVQSSAVEQHSNSDS